jgi:hypothetical protein
VGKVYRHEGKELVEAGMEEAERHHSEGFAAMKLKVGLRGRPRHARTVLPPRLARPISLGGVRRGEYCSQVI